MSNYNDYEQELNDLKIRTKEALEEHGKWLEASMELDITRKGKIIRKRPTDIRPIKYNSNEELKMKLDIEKEEKDENRCKPISRNRKLFNSNRTLPMHKRKR